MKLRFLKNKWIAAVASALALSTSVQAAELKTVNMCAFTLMGEGGPDYQLIMDYKTAALNWGVKLNVKPYMSEKVVVEELKSGVCDIANMTTIQARIFNKFTGSIDAPGAIPTYKHLKLILQTLAKPSAAKYMRSGEYETIGIQPAGAVFLFTNDRNIESLSDMAGKKMAILESMPELRQMVIDMGMTPVSSTVSNIFQKFNNKVVDITGGPAIVYDIMELHKGLEPNGGILETPIIQATAQFVARADKIPEGFGQKSREYFITNFEESIKVISEAENNIPKKWWIPLPKNREAEFHAQTRKIRLGFRDAGVYEPKTLTLLRKVRCKVDATLAECTSADAE